MAQCITCGTELHPERARKYNYCMARECQEKNAKGLTMMAVGMNKAAEELMILDERTQAEPGGAARDHETPARGARQRPARQTAGPAARGRSWTDRQERLALLYNEKGLRPDEIAAKLGVSTYAATQIVLAARDRRQRRTDPAGVRADPSRRTRRPR